MYSITVHLVHICGWSDKHSKVTSVDFPGLEVFKRSVITKLKQVPDSRLFFKSRAHKVCSRWVDDKAQSITVLNVKFFRLSWSKGNSVAKYVVTLVTSHVVEYLGIGVRTLYIPLRSLEISGWDQERQSVLKSEGDRLENEEVRGYMLP